MSIAIKIVWFLGVGALLVLLVGLTVIGVAALRLLFTPDAEEELERERVPNSWKPDRR